MTQQPSREAADSTGPDQWPGEFVLLEHDTTEAASPAGPPLHWDFMLTLPGQVRLATWRLLQNPLTAALPIRLERIGDHRRDYLVYEGELSGGRGRVRRIDRGPARIELRDATRLIVLLCGHKLSGRFDLRDDVCEFARGL